MCISLLYWCYWALCCSLIFVYNFQIILFKGYFTNYWASPSEMVLKEMKCKVTHTEAPCTAEIQIHLSPKIRVEERGKFNSTFVFYSTFTHLGKTEKKLTKCWNSRYFDLQFNTEITVCSSEIWTMGKGFCHISTHGPKGNTVVINTHQFILSLFTLTTLISVNSTPETKFIL